MVLADKPRKDNNKYKINQTELFINPKFLEH